jgi:hypothetical protein
MRSGGTAMLDDAYYDFVKLTERERLAYDIAYRSAIKVTRNKAQARYAAERAVFAEARRDRYAQQDQQARR